MTGDLINPGPASTGAGMLSPDLLERETFAAVMPQVFLSLLERRYLADFEPARWQVSPTPDDHVRPLLREVLAVGRPLPGAAVCPSAARATVQSVSSWNDSIRAWTDFALIHSSNSAAPHRKASGQRPSGGAGAR